MGSEYKNNNNVNCNYYWYKIVANFDIMNDYNNYNRKGLNNNSYSSENININDT